ncbi:MAG: hypothetical protein M3381_12945 [Actinomycetota bacterium]|nr:hypothetical protein [Actinomycetota bacterium]
MALPWSPGPEGPHYSAWRVCWRAPVIGLGLFAVMFALSVIVIGPVINGMTELGRASVPAVEQEDHN